MTSKNLTTSVRKGLGRVAPLLAAGLIALGVSGAARADSYRYHDGPRGADRVVVINHYDRGHRYDRWHRRHYRPRREVVIVDRYYAPPPRQVVVEQYAYPAYPTYSAPAPVRYDTPPFTAQGLVGAAIGGLLGSQIGHGSGRLAATAAGTFTGLFIGSQVGR